MFVNLPDSPQGIGDIVGLAARQVRANFKEIFRLLIVPTIFTVVAGTAAQWAFSSGLSNVVQGKSPAGDVLGLAALWFSGLAVYVLAYWLLALRLFAFVRLLLGFSPTLEAALENLYRKKFRMIGVAVLSLLIGAAIFAVFAIIAFACMMLIGTGTQTASAIGFVLFAVGAGVVCAFYPLITNFGLCIMACEEEGAADIVGRSVHLVFRHFWRTLAFGIIFVVTLALVSYPMTLPAVIVAAGEGFMHGLAASKGKVASGSYQPTLWTLVFAETWTALAWMYLRPFAVFAFSLFYYDMRLRSEGLDIGRKMELALPLHSVEMEQ